jgi:hypothetical protein
VSVAAKVHLAGAPAGSTAKMAMSTDRRVSLIPFPFLTVRDIYGATFKDVLPPVYSLFSAKTKKTDANLMAKGKVESQTS